MQQVVMIHNEEDLEYVNARLEEGWKVTKMQGSGKDWVLVLLEADDEFNVVDEFNEETPSKNQEDEDESDEGFSFMELMDSEESKLNDDPFDPSMQCDFSRVPPGMKGGS